MKRSSTILIAIAGFVIAAWSASVDARPPIRAAFFGVYPGADGTALDQLPSDSKHCGVCHFDFSGGGARNPYGLAIEVGIGNGLSDAEAVAAIENDDSDGDGFSSLVEITDLTNFGNTPTFPGLSAGNVGSTSNIPLTEIVDVLTPSGGTDTTPPTVAVTGPDGGESLPGAQVFNVTYTATDSSGVSKVHVYLSDDGGATYDPVGLNLSPSGVFSWFVPNLPGTQNLIRVVAVDNAANQGSDDSDGTFTIQAVTGGYVPSTLRDLTMNGMQPLTGVVLDDPQDCFTCHAGYDPANEPGRTWSGSMMAQAARDPLFFAAVAVAEQDAPSSGDLCIRCHSPGGWLEGRSVDTSGGLLTDKDREGVQCDFCHRMVDYDYQPGVSPPQDSTYLAGVPDLPGAYANGMFLADPAPVKRGPFADAVASHEFVESPLHRSSNHCGTCHDVSNPVFVRVGGRDYAPDALDSEHPDMDLRNMFPIERTFSEWSISDYADGGVFAPQFAGNKPDGIVSSCQDCHMPDASAAGCNVDGAPTRPDLPRHEFVGGNTFIPDVLADMFPGEVDIAALAASKQAAIGMLQRAVTLELLPTETGVAVRVTNEGAHKLPSGYPEGRRVWLHVEAVDGAEATVFESGAYDAASGVLTHDEHLKIYEIHPGLSPSLAGALGLPPGPSFHFVLNDTVYFDNRIPPRGATLLELEDVQSPPVGYTYADNQYWDETDYALPASAESVRVTVYYQTTSKEYVEFLRDANVTNTAGDDLYDAWVAQGKAPPVAMAYGSAAVNVTQSAVADGGPVQEFALGRARPNPFSETTRIAYTVPASGRARLAVFDLTGRRVRVLVDERAEPGVYESRWDGRDERGLEMPAGIYFLRFTAGDQARSARIVYIR